MRVTISRKAHFNAAHRLFRKDWSDAQNISIFGKCSNPHYHGHNYELIAHITGEIDPETGYVMDMKVLKDLIKDEIEDEFDHRNLNLDCPDFKDLNPTAENIAKVIYQRLKPKLEQYSLTIKLYETQNNIAEYSGK